MKNWWFKQRLSLFDLVVIMIIANLFEGMFKAMGWVP